MSPLEGVAEKDATVERVETRAVFVARGRLSPAKVLCVEFSKDFRLLKSREEWRLKIMMNDRLRDIGEFVPGPDDDLVICRCEEITKGEIRRAVHDGMFTMQEIRRYLRAGMGLCQGQTCSKLVKGIVAAEQKVSPAAVNPATSRGPIRPTEMGTLASEVL